MDYFRDGRQGQEQERGRRREVRVIDVTSNEDDDIRSSSLPPEIRDLFREQIVQSIFTDIPVGERHLWLERIDQQLSQQRKAMSKEKRRRMFRILWIYNNRIPLPYVNYKRVIKILHLKKIYHLVKSVVMMVFSVIRWIFIAYIIFSQWLPMLRFFVEVHNMVTFSSNFLGQVLSYFCHNNDALVSTGLSIHQAAVLNYYNNACRLHKFDFAKGKLTSKIVNEELKGFSMDSVFVPYLITIVEKWYYAEGWFTVPLRQDDGKVVDVSIYRAIKDALYKKLASLLMVKCTPVFIEHDVETFTCALDNDTLIFKFSKVLSTFFPRLGDISSENNWFLKLNTLSVWIMYSMGAYLVCTGILYVCILRLMRIMARYIDVFKGIVKSLAVESVF